MFKRSYDFCVYYFQNIMDAEYEGYKGFSQLRERVELAQTYQDAFGLHAYKKSQVWNIIVKKYNKYFDTMMDEVFNGNKH